MESQREPEDKRKNENDDSRKIAIALLFLLLSCSCIFCSSQGALWMINEDHVAASILSDRMADYGADLGIAAAPLDRIALSTEILQDDILLQQTVTTSGIGAVVMVIPSALPSATPIPVAQLVTPTPTPPPSSPATPNSQPTSLPTVEPAPTLPPTATDVLPTPIVPTPTDIIPTPTEPVPTLPLPTPTDVPSPTNTPNPTSTNTPVPDPDVFFSAANFNVNEAAGTVTVFVSLSAASANTITVNYTTTDGSAVAPGDYTAVSNILTFAPGQTMQPIVIPIVDDGVDELDETFRVTLSIPVNATLGTPNPTTVTIIDDDMPSVQFDNTTYTVDEDQGPAIITVTLSMPSPLTVTVTYATSDGTATAGNDYASTGGTLTFLPGQTSMNFAVPITDDVLPNEFIETVNLTLSNPNNAALGPPNPATLEIVDNDQLEVEFSSANYTVVEDAGTATITVTLSTVSPITATVNYATMDSTPISATAGSDYVSVTGILTFAPGDTIGTFAVPIIDDAGQEVPEILTLDLSSPVNATLGATIPATLTIIDDGDTESCIDFAPPTVEIGPPDCRWTALDAATVVVTLPTTIGYDGDPDYDLVYYEREAPAPSGYIALDRVSVWVGTSITGPWVEVFNWGNGVADDNTNIGQAGYGPPEPNDTNIPLTMPPLYRPSASTIASGIAIDIDAIIAALPVPPPVGTNYTHVQLIGGGTAEVDSIDVIP